MEATGQTQHFALFDFNKAQKGRANMCLSSKFKKVGRVVCILYHTMHNSEVRSRSCEIVLKDPLFIPHDRLPLN